VKLFEREKDPEEEVGRLIEELACREIRDVLVALVKERTYGPRRWPLCLALAKLKHADAADALASMLGQGPHTRRAIAMLGGMGAVWQGSKVRRFLDHEDPEIRAEAEAALRAMGLALEAPPEAVHVASRREMPKNLAMWSAPVDTGRLAEALENLTIHIERGFGPPEIGEVLGVAPEMRPGQTRAFRFRIVIGLKRSELWLTLSAEQRDVWTLEIHGRADLIGYFESTLAGRTNGRGEPRRRNDVPAPIPAGAH
jgi:hypothetical protein